MTASENRMNSQKFKREYTKEMFIEDLNLTRDAVKLARCLNSFDDSDSWPGGFTQGNPFTAERLIDEWSKSQSEARLVVHVDDKIVGISIIDKHWRMPNSYYVGLLGVDPAYQKQGYGKKLLQCSVDFVTSLNADRLDLHTWEGNLKAMPLYKRTGFNWYPGTSVLMENYIPQILQHNFKEFLTLENWYQQLDRPIEQKQDEFFVKGEKSTPIFKYHFNLPEKGWLDVNIDIESKKISGFSLNSIDLKCEIQTMLKNKIGYIGSKNNTLSWILTNNEDVPILINGKLKPSTGITFLTESSKKSVSLLPNETKVIDFQFSIHPNVNPVDKEQIHEEQSHILIQSLFLVSKTSFQKEIILNTGIVTQEPFQIGFTPEVPILRPERIESFQLNITNKTPINQKVALKLMSANFKVLDYKSEEQLIPAHRAIQIPVNIQVPIDNKRSFLDIEFTCKENYYLLKRQRELTILAENAITTCSFPNEHYSLENSKIRIFFRTKKECQLYKIYDKINNQIIHLRGLIDAVGFPYESQEMTRIPYKVNRLMNGIELSATKPSMPQIKLIKRIELLKGEPVIKVTYIVENNGNTTVKSSGLRTATAQWGFNLRTIFPTERGIISAFDDPQFNQRDDYKKILKTVNEGWIFRENYRLGTIGIVWDKESFENPVTDKNAIIRLEKKFELLGNNKKIFNPIYIVVGAENWQSMKRYSERFYGNINSVPRYQKHSQAIQFNLSKIQGNLKQNSLFIESKHPDKLFLTVKNETEREFDSEFILKSEDIKFDPQKIALKIEKESEYSRSISTKVLSNDKTTFSYSYSFISPIAERKYNSRIIKSDSTKPVTIFFPSDLNITSPISVTNGVLSFETSLDFKGSPHYLRYKGLDINILYSKYPLKEPFLWYNPFYGGIVFWLMQLQQDFGLAGLSKCDFTVKKTEANGWNGIKFSPINLERNFLLKSISTNFSYLLHPGSNILRIDFSIKNNSIVPIELFSGISTFVNPKFDQIRCKDPYCSRELTFRRSLQMINSTVPIEYPWLELEDVTANTPKIGFIKKENPIIESRRRMNIELQEKLIEVFEATSLQLQGYEEITRTFYIIVMDKEDDISNYSTLILP